MPVKPAIQVDNQNEYQALRATWQGQRVALVPTMGALHEGHLSLIRFAKQQADRVIVSIFVNPLQFGPNEDFSRYPRTLEADLTACEAACVDAVYVPDVSEIYPQGMEDTTLIVPPEGLTSIFCGKDRPGHFTGVATVVHKLFQLLKPDVAVFGEKDAQQLAVIQQMVKDLLVPVEIVPHPIVRESDGLAMSSRNRYLTTPEDRALALVLSKTLFAIQEQLKAASFLPAYATGEDVLSRVLETLPEAERERFSLEYLQPVIPSGFEPTVVFKRGFRVLMAAKISLPEGKTVRLIDNLLL